MREDLFQVCFTEAISLSDDTAQSVEPCLGLLFTCLGKDPHLHKRGTIEVLEANLKTSLLKQTKEHTSLLFQAQF